MTLCEQPYSCIVREAIKILNTIDWLETIYIDKLAHSVVLLLGHILLSLK